MSSNLERDVRFLKGYAVITTLALGLLSLAAFTRQQPDKVKFREIDVERINVMEPNGMYRMVISNKPRSIGPIYKGKPFGYAGGTRAGIVFFNDEGTENGGLSVAGARAPDGTVRAQTHMSFDQFNQDQVMNLDYTEDLRGRLIGISMLDRADVDIRDLVAERDSLRRIADTTARNAALARLATMPRNGQPLQAQRLFIGRDRAKAARLDLADRDGKPRLRVAVDSLGNPRIDFLDASGRVTFTLPPAAADSGRREQ